MKMKSYSLMMLLLFFFGLPQTIQAADVPEDSLYRAAVKLEKAGRRDSALTIMGSLYEKSPASYSYYQTYRRILVGQRDFEGLQTLLEDRLRRYPQTLSVEMELGVVAYHLGRNSRARAHFESVYRKGRRGFSSSYAVIAYNRVVEYRLFEDFPGIVSLLREIGKDETLLYRQYFMLTCRYMQWEEASDELLHVVLTHPVHLNRLNTTLFRLPDDSPMFSVSLEKLADRSENAAHIARSRIYFHLRDYSMAVEELVGPKGADVQIERKSLISRLEKREEYTELIRLAGIAVENTDNMREKDLFLQTMAQSYEKLHLAQENAVSAVDFPYASDYITIPFSMRGESDESRRAVALYDTLMTRSRETAVRAAEGRARLKLFTMNDPDGAEKDLQFILKQDSPRRLEAVILLSRVFEMRGDWQTSREFLTTAAAQYKLSAAEEDDLLPLQFMADFLCGEQDSSLKILREMTALMDEDDPQYNDILNLTAYLTDALADTLTADMAMRLEREIRQNNLAAAAEICLQIPPGSPVRPVFMARYVDIVRHLGNEAAEAEFWQRYGRELAKSERGDFFIFREAEFMKKKHADIKKVIEKYEEILLTYPLSPICYPARERIAVLNEEGYSHE